MRPHRKQMRVRSREADEANVHILHHQKSRKGPQLKSAAQRRPAKSQRE